MNNMIRVDGVDMEFARFGGGEGTPILVRRSIGYEINCLNENGHEG